MSHQHDYLKTEYEALWINDYESHDVGKTPLDMEQWSILSTQIDYVHYDKYTNGHFKVDVKSPEDKYNNKIYTKFQDSERTIKDLNFDMMSDQRKEDYFESYEGVNITLKNSVAFNENKDIATTYLGKKVMKRQDKLRAEEKFPMLPNGMTMGELLNGAECHMLLDSGASKSFMSKQFYLNNKCLHSLPKFISDVKNLQVGNGQLVNILFIVPVIINIHGHLFEIYTAVAEIHNSVDIVFGLKNMYEIEAELSTRDSNCKFLNRSLPFFPKEKCILKSKERKYVKIDVPFTDEISSMAIVKLLDYETQSTVTLKLKFTRNNAMLDVTNTGTNSILLDPEKHLGIVDIRSIGYYKIKHDTLQQGLSKHYEFENFINLCDSYNKMVTEKYNESKLYNDQNDSISKDPYPWLEKDDIRRHMTDREILEKYIRLDESCLSDSGKIKLLNMLYKYKDAFSLRDEIGTSVGITVDIDLIDKTPFFIRPYNIAEEDKPIMDKEMNRLVHLGILKKGFSNYSSPVMLISRKLTKDKRPVVDFRYANARVLKYNCAFPLLRDTFKILGDSQCEVLSVFDVKDAFHSLKLSEKSKKYVGIQPYYGSQTYIYDRLPQGWGGSPAIFQTYINTILKQITMFKKQFIALMDDILAFSSKANHMALIETFLKSMITNGLKLSPKKCQLFRTAIQYMGNKMFIKDKRVCVTPLRSRIEAIQKLRPPSTPKECRSFAGMVQYLSMFCPDLQELLKPIYDLTKKNVKFIWTFIQQNAFEEIKRRLVKPPVLHLPDSKGRLQLFSDTSKISCGASLWQRINGKPRLIGYASKRMPEAAKNYSITELELCGLAINIASFKHLLANRSFDCVTDHSALIYLIKSKNEPPSNRIKRLLEILSNYSFNLYYIKGRDMKLCDFLSRVKIHDPSPNEVIPISFSLHDMVTEEIQPVIMDCYNILHDSYYNLCDPFTLRYNIGTRSAAKAKGEILPAVHGADKKLDPHKKPEHQKAPKLVKQPAVTQPVASSPQVIEVPQRKQSIKGRAGQGRAGLRRKLKPIQSQPIKSQPVIAKPILPKKILTTQVTHQPEVAQPRSITQTVTQHVPYPDRYEKPPYVEPLIRPPPKPVRQENIKPDHGQRIDIDYIEPDLNTDIEENSPYQDTAYDETIARPTEKDLLIPPSLESQIRKEVLVHKHLPKQVDLERLLKQIQRKILKGTHLSTTVKEIKTGYVNSTHFKDIYLYLALNKLPRSKAAIRRIETLSERYILLDGLLLKISKIDSEYPEPKLCVPESCVDAILDLYHSSILAGHQGTTKCLLTISDRFFIPNLAHYIRMYIASCHKCQMTKQGKAKQRYREGRIFLNYRPMSKVSMDIKYMPKATNGMKFILVIVDDNLNYMITVPLPQIKTELICEALIVHLISKHSLPDMIICDMDATFMSSLMEYMMNMFKIKLKMVSPYNHGSLKAEAGIKAISNMLIKHLTGQGRDWPLYLPISTLIYNCYNTPNLGGLSPFELVCGKKPRLIIDLETDLDIKVSRSFKEYYDCLQKRLKYLQGILIKFKSNRQAVMNKDIEPYYYQKYDLVYMINPATSLLRTESRKFAIKYGGPLVILKLLSNKQFILMTLNGRIIPRVIEFERIKPAIIRTSQGNVHNLVQLRQVLSAGIKL